MSERLFSIIIFLIGFTEFFLGTQVKVRFLTEPIGPARFPVFLGIGLMSLAGFMILKGSSKDRALPEKSILLLVCYLIFYYCSFQLLGFMLSTTITVYLLARLTGGSWMQGLLTGLIISILFYGIFHFLLNVPLPIGRIFGVTN